MTLSGVLAKPKSVKRPEYSFLSELYDMPDLSREWAADAGLVVQTLESRLGLKGKDVVLVDIGGYFAPSINAISETFDGRILGVLEGTENGVVRYEQEDTPFNPPIVTVARSPLKLPEDHLVASSVVFSIEAVLRENAEILQTRSATVIGYGRVGSSVADILRGRGINTV
ncbi:MAG: adenosylhomocysteinase, partial [Verrucomicrobiaceae bacterium]